MKVTPNSRVQETQRVGNDEAVAGTNRFFGKALKGVEANWARNETTPVYSGSGFASRTAAVDTSTRVS